MSETTTTSGAPAPKRPRRRSATEQAGADDTATQAPKARTTRRRSADAAAPSETTQAPAGQAASAQQAAEAGEAAPRTRRRRATLSSTRPEQPAPPAETAAAETAPAEAGPEVAVRRAAEASVTPEAAARPGSTLTVAVGRAMLAGRVVGADGTAVGVRVEVPSSLPCKPEDLVDELRRAVAAAPAFERVSVGFPGTVRDGRVLTVPSYVSGAKGSLRDAWVGFDLGRALQVALGKPVRVTGATVLAGAGVIQGRGLELVVTLDEGFGASLFLDGRPTPQLDLAGHEFRKGATYAEQLGDAGRRRAGRRKWNRRVQLALAALDRLMAYDRVYVGGQNARHISVDLGPKARVLDDGDAEALSGGARLWDEATL